MQGIDVELLEPPANPLMSQPPHDTLLGDGALCHYTWATILEEKENKTEVWRFEKREYTSANDALKVAALTSLATAEYIYVALSFEYVSP